MWSALVAVRAPVSAWVQVVVVVVQALALVSVSAWVQVVASPVQALAMVVRAWSLTF